MTTSDSDAGRADDAFGPGPMPGVHVPGGLRAPEEPPVTVTAPDGQTAASQPARPPIRIAQVAVGSVMMAGDQVKGGVRTAGGRTAAVVLGLLAKTKDQTDRARDRLAEVMDDAERRGRDTLAARRTGVTATAAMIVTSTVDDALAWAQVKVVPQVIDDLVPHLISDVVPRLIDGALPEIRDRVVPVIIADLTTDARVQELIVEQSRGVLGQIAEQLRTNTGRADDRLEATAHRVVGREKTAPPKGLNEIRSL
jgi:hypothetical protein